MYTSNETARTPIRLADSVLQAQVYFIYCLLKNIYHVKSRLALIVPSLSAAA